MDKKNFETLPKIKNDINSLNTIKIGKSNNTKIAYTNYDKGDDNILKKSIPKTRENRSELKSNSPFLMKNETIKKIKVLTKYKIKLNEGNPLEPEFLAKKLREKPLIEKDDYSTAGLKETINEKNRNNISSPENQSKKPTTKNSPIKNKNSGLTYIIQDI